MCQVNYCRLKGYWQLDTYQGGVDDLKDCLTTAERCAEFQLHESLQKVK